MNLQEQEKDELKDETLLHSKPQVCEPRKTVCIYHEMYFLFAEIPWETNPLNHSVPAWV